MNTIILWDRDIAEGIFFPIQGVTVPRSYCLCYGIGVSVLNIDYTASCLGRTYQVYTNICRVTFMLMQVLPFCLIREVIKYM